MRHAYTSARLGERIHYRSRKLAFLSEITAKSHKEFPYDVPYLRSGDVWKLVALSKQYWVSDLAMLRLREEFHLPPKIVKQLEPLHSSEGTMRFFEDDFWHESEKCLGSVTVNRYREALKHAATEGFLRQDTPQWTPERAEAHLQDDDIVAKRASVHSDLWKLYTQYREAGRPMTEAQLKRWIEIKRIEETLRPPSWFITNLPERQKKSEKRVQKLWDQELVKSGVDLQKAQKSHFDLFTEAGKDLK